MQELLLGDVIDDFCGRCRLITNHSIVSLVNGDPVKVHCRTCFFEHNYLKGMPGARKKPASKKAALFDAVLSSIVGAPPPAEASPVRRGRKKE